MSMSRKNTIIKYKYNNQTMYYIDIYDKEDGSFMKRLSEEDIYNLCGRNDEMFEDYIKHVRTHPYVKCFHQNWILREE